MSGNGKNYRAALAKVDRTQRYPLEDSLRLVKDTARAKFDKTVEMAIRLGVGPRGLMPNPKTGTVTVDIGKAVREIKAGKLEFRVDKAGIIHVAVGKASFGPEQLIDNAKAVLMSVLRAKPASAKGNFVRGVTVSTTMGPGIKVELSQIRAMAP